MSSQTNSPSSAVNDNSVGTVAWSNPTYALSSDNQYAIFSNATVDNTFYYSNYLKVSNFGFSIPAGSTINGVVVGVEVNDSTYGSGDGFEQSDDIAKLVVGGSVVGDNKSLGTNFGYPDHYRSYGSSSDVWGNSLTPDIINSSDFGFAVSAKSKVYGTRTREDTNIDYITITVYYTEGGTTYTLTASATNFSYTAQNAILKASRKLSCTVTSYSYTTVNAIIAKVLKFVLSVGAYPYTTNNATLKVARKLITSAVDFAFTPYEITITKQGILVKKCTIGTGTSNLIIDPTKTSKFKIL